MKYKIKMDINGLEAINQVVDTKDFAISGGIMCVSPLEPAYCTLFEIKLIDYFDYLLIITDDKLNHIIENYENNDCSYHPNMFTKGIFVIPEPDKPKPSFQSIPDKIKDKILENQRKGKYRAK